MQPVNLMKGNRRLDCEQWETDELEVAETTRPGPRLLIVSPSKRVGFAGFRTHMFRLRPVTCDQRAHSRRPHHRGRFGR